MSKQMMKEGGPTQNKLTPAQAKKLEERKAAEEKAAAKKNMDEMFLGMTMDERRLASIRNNSPKPDERPAAKGTGMMKGGMAKYVKGGLKKPTEAQAGVKKLPTKVRNKMGFMKKGGDVKKMNMGASTMMKEGGTAKGKSGKPRGCGIARKGIRKTKMR
tara:strand:- start:45 stop:521 length:477 start_codon:yes stop_codon:yes gene_type:complete